MGIGVSLTSRLTELSDPADLVLPVRFDVFWAIRLDGDWRHVIPADDHTREGGRNAAGGENIRSTMATGTMVSGGQ